MKSKSFITFLSALAVAGCWLLISSGQRNGFWECCDTRAWGFPLPWRVEGGCGAAPSFRTSLVVNSACAAGFAAGTAWLAGRRQRSSRRQPSGPGRNRGKRR